MARQRNLERPSPAGLSAQQFMDGAAGTVIRWHAAAALDKSATWEAAKRIETYRDELGR